MFIRNQKYDRRQPTIVPVHEVRSCFIKNEGGFAIVVNLKDVDQRHLFKASDFSIESLVNSGSPLLSNPVTMHDNPLGVADTLVDGIGVMSNIESLISEENE